MMKKIFLFNGVMKKPDNASMHGMETTGESFRICVYAFSHLLRNTGMQS